MNDEMAGIFSRDYTEFRCLCGKYRGKQYSQIGCCDRCGNKVMERTGLAMYLREMHGEGTALLYKKIFNDDKIEVFDTKGYALRETLANALEPIEFVAMSEIYGLIAHEGRNFDEIGKMLNISANRVSQIETEALKKLRHPIYTIKLKGYTLSQDGITLENQAGGVSLDKLRKIRNILLRHAEEVKGNYEVPWLDQKPLSMKNANKFFLGAIINYRAKLETAWDPWDNAKRFSEEYLGDPSTLWNHIVDTYTMDAWESKKEELHLHWLSAAHRRGWRIGYEIVKRYNGDIRNIWHGENSDVVRAALERMRCGPKISDLIIGWLINYGYLEGPAHVAADTHVCKVLGCIFYGNPHLDPESARQLARRIHPENPWELDLPLYDIGKHYCEPPGEHNRYYCERCPLGIKEGCEGYRRFKLDKL